MDSLLNRLSQNRQTWADLGWAERIRHLRHGQEGVRSVAGEWVRQACLIKGIDPHSPLAGEEWLTGPITVVRTLRLLQQAMQAQGIPPLGAIRWRKDEPSGYPQAIVSVFPAPGLEQGLWLGTKGEIWLEPGQNPTQGSFYQHSPRPGKVALVLGAGNITAIPLLDTLHKLFVEGSVVILKLNPLHTPLQACWEKALETLVTGGFLAIVSGGSETGQLLSHDPRVDTLHITGSHHTYNRIIWGEDPTHVHSESRIPLVTLPTTAELGGITPVIVVPGQWSASDLEFQARHVAGMVTNNAGFNCTAAQVLITARHWPQRLDFLKALHQELAKTPLRPAYYPGSLERYQTFLSHYPQAEPLGSGGSLPGGLPWTVIPDLPAQPGEYALTHEAFCGLLAETSLEPIDPAAFLSQAVEFCNQAIWGNLSCVILADSRTLKLYEGAVEDAIAALHYGTVGLNIWAGVSFCLGVTPWGAYPGNPPERIQSGQGKVHNTLLLDNPQKTVMRASFRIRPAPLWLNQRRHLLRVSRRLMTFEAHPTWSAWVGLVLSSLLE